MSGVSMKFAVLVALPLVANAFTSSDTFRLHAPSHSKLNLFNKQKTTENTSTRPSQFDAPKSGSGNILEKTFTGGAFEEEDANQILASAITIASKIKSTRDLGWTNPSPKRKGNARPRHRAWGGEGEMPVQSKPNYDESKENCVEKWLTMEDFLTVTRSQPGPAADTVFVALAGGAKYAERDVCEKTIEQWTASDGAGSTSGAFGRKTASFNEAAFIKSVKDGRTDLGLGWSSFLSLNGFCASCILFPTNPAAKGLESLVDFVKASAAPVEVVSSIASTM